VSKADGRPDTAGRREWQRRASSNHHRRSHTSPAILIQAGAGKAQPAGVDGTHVRVGTRSPTIVNNGIRELRPASVLTLHGPSSWHGIRRCNHTAMKTENTAVEKKAENELTTWAVTQCYCMGVDACAPTPV
jgi:hypothetical protein